MFDGLVNTKKCTNCGNVYKLTQFNKRKASRDGLTYWCKGCMKEKHITLRQFYNKVIDYKTELLNNFIEERAMEQESIRVYKAQPVDNPKRNPFF